MRFGEIPYPNTAKQVHTEKCIFNPLSANFTKWSNTLKQFVGNMPTNCVSVFDYFVGLALNGLKHSRITLKKGPSMVLLFQGSSLLVLERTASL